MRERILVVAPHPDDETLGCGGALLRHKSEQDELHWLIITGMQVDFGFSQEQVQRRECEIQEVVKSYDFSSVNNLRLPTTKLDTLSIGELISNISQVFQDVQPEALYLPYRGDAHTDHQIVFDAVTACTKWFRHPSIRRVLAYETLSETDLSLNPDANGFRPNVFVNITSFLEEKLAIMETYATETGEFPFPRSGQALRALAALRGVACGYQAAEGFMLLKERY